MIKAILFDYGDTLVVPRTPDEEIIPAALKESFKVYQRNGLETSFAKFVEEDGRIFKRYAELEKAEQRDIPDLAKNLELVSIFLPELEARKRRKIALQADDTFWHVVARCHRLRFGTRLALSQLNEMGLQMGVVSNHHNGRALRAHLKALGISSYFSSVVVSSELHYRKPDPRIFRRCATNVGTKPVDCLFLGDSPAFDIAGATEAGMLTVLIMKRILRKVDRAAPTVVPNYTIRDIRKLPNIVRKANGH